MRNAARRAYLRRFVPAMVAYAVLVVLATSILGGPNAPSGWIVYAIALLPALPMIAVFAIIGRYLVEERDEYLRMLMVRQSLVATGFALSLASLWGFLEMLAGAPHVPMFYVPVAWFAGLGLGACWNKLRP